MSWLSHQSAPKTKSSTIGKLFYIFKNFWSLWYRKFELSSEIFHWTMTRLQKISSLLLPNNPAHRPFQFSNLHSWAEFGDLVWGEEVKPPGWRIRKIRRNIVYRRHLGSFWWSKNRQKMLHFRGSLKDDCQLLLVNFSGLSVIGAWTEQIAG